MSKLDRLLGNRDRLLADALQRRRRLALAVRGRTRHAPALLTAAALSTAFVAGWITRRLGDRKRPPSADAVADAVIEKLGDRPLQSSGDTAEKAGILALAGTLLTTVATRIVAQRLAGWLPGPQAPASHDPAPQHAPPAEGFTPGPGVWHEP